MSSRLVLRQQQRRRATSSSARLLLRSASSSNPCLSSSCATVSAAPTAAVASHDRIYPSSHGGGGENSAASMAAAAGLAIAAATAAAAAMTGSGTARPPAVSSTADNDGGESRSSSRCRECINGRVEYGEEGGTGEQPGIVGKAAHLRRTYPSHFCNYSGGQQQQQQQQQQQLQSQWSSTLDITDRYLSKSTLSTLLQSPSIQSVLQLSPPTLCDSTTDSTSPKPKMQPQLQRSKRAPAKNLLSRSGIGGGARNVMLHRMRSMRARDLSEKYKVDWKNVLGEGAYGSVHPARLAATGEKVALKKMKKRYTNTSSFRTETDALLRIYDNGGHPNVAGLRDMYEDYSHFYLVMDLVSGGEMFEHLINYGAYSEADAARLMQEVASALFFLHGVGVVHADLKPENLLLCSKKKSDGTIKIIDFGCAIVSHDNYHDDVDDEDEDIYENFDDKDGYARPKKTSVGGSHTITVSTAGKIPSTGTTAYWAPERFSYSPGGGRRVPDAPCDMWSLGVILYIMLTGAHPFDITGVSTDAEIEERIKTDPSPPITPELTGHLSPSAVDLISKLMARDPEKRLTAREMLSHPWVCGEEAATTKIADSAIKLARFKDLRTKVEAGIFAVLVDRGNRDATLSEAKVLSSEEHESGGHGGNIANGGGRNASSTHIMKRAFEVFDAEGKGYVSPDDLGRIVKVATGKSLSSDEQRDMLAAAAAASSTNGGGGSRIASGTGLSLSDFSGLFGRLKHKHFPRGHVIFRAGDPGGSMYFINSGKVEIQTRKGQLVSILRHGDFFGEGSMLEDKNVRFTTAKASTPVDVIKISKDDFDRYIASSSEAKHTLKRKWRARLLRYAKNLIRLQTNLKEKTFKSGDVIYKEGDVGKSMYLVDDGRLEVKHGDVSVHEYLSGDSFGESSLIFERKRSSTVVCASDTCKLHEMVGSDFLAVLESSPDAAASLRDMCRKRLFKKAVKTFSLGKKRGLTNEDIVAAFYEADEDGSGLLSYDELKALMHRMDPTIPDQEIRLLLKFIDVDEDGLISLEEFKRLFRSFEHEEQRRKRF